VPQVAPETNAHPIKTNRPPAESEPSKAAKADDAGPAEHETADAGRPAGTKSADGKTGETDHGGTNDPIVLTDASAEADAVEQIDVATSADSFGEA
jgi:hypothetical protein